MKPIFLTAITATSGGLFEVEALRCGEWAHPDAEGGAFQITPEMLASMERHFREGAKGWELQLSLDHERPCGWVKDVSTDGESLYAVFEVTEPDIAALVENGTLKYASAEIDMGWLDPESQTRKVVLEGLALTNHPYIKRMEPVKRATVNLSQPLGRRGPKTMIPTPTHTQPEPLSDINKDQVIADLESRLKFMEGKQKESLAQIHLQHFHAKLSDCFRSGKLTVPAYRKALRLGEVLIRGGATEYQLPAKVRLSELSPSAEGGPDAKNKTIDRIEILRELLDILAQLPDSIATDPDFVNLEEDDPDKNKNDVLENDLVKQADELQREQPGMTRAQAITLAARRKGIKSLYEVRK